MCFLILPLGAAPSILTETVFDCRSRDAAVIASSDRRQRGPTRAHGRSRKFGNRLYCRFKSR